MEKKNLLINPPQKVLLMYDAVGDMLSEGCDVNTIKVVEITTRAGIGKGTAYEYFSSKEEIIIMAIAYDITKKINTIERIVDETPLFQDKVEKLLDFVSENFSKNHTFCTLVRIGTGSYEISDALRREYKEMQEILSYTQAEKIVDRVMECGATEGKIREEKILLRRIAFCSQIMSFACYFVTKNREKEIGVTEPEMKRFVYEGLVKILN